MFNSRLGALIFTCLLLQGCILHKDKNPHNDVLVFGTTTKFALDVSAPVQNSGIPEFTLGYKRLEAVWMPLKTNGTVDKAPSSNVEQVIDDINKCTEQLAANGMTGEQKAKFCLTAILPADKYVSISSGIDSSKGGNSLEIDTYSVFASLGAKGSLSSSSASGNLAQFFATGVAAQRLGANPTVAAILNAEGSTAIAEVAKANAEEKKTELAIVKEQANAKKVQVSVDQGVLAAKAIIGKSSDVVTKPNLTNLAIRLNQQGCDTAYFDTLDKTSVDNFLDELNTKRPFCLNKLGERVNE